MKLGIAIFAVSLISAVNVRGETPPVVAEFISTHCLDCHSGESAEAGFDLKSLAFNLDDGLKFGHWVQVHDRVQRGQMPPADTDQPDAGERNAFVSGLRGTLIAHSRTRQARDGRVQYRRLNRIEYEHTLRDLLSLPHLEVSEMLPPDNASSGFDNVGSALDLSYVQISRYLEASRLALDHAMVLTPQPKQEVVRLEAKTNGRFSQVLRKGEEAVLIGNAVGLMRQPNTAQAPWWWSKFVPPIDGNYRLRMKTFGFVWDKGKVLPADRNHVITYYAVQGTTKRPIGTFDVGPSPEEPSIHEFTAFIRQGDQLQVWFETLDDRNKKRDTPLDNYSAPGVAVEWIEIEGPLFEQWPSASYQALFGNLPMEPWTAETGLRQPALPMIVDGVGKRAKLVQAKPNKTTLMHVVTESPYKDAKRLLKKFARRAFRRPIEPGELSDIDALIESKLEQKFCFQEAMRVGFQAVLCSPEFLFLQEQPGELNTYALASRLSYFLWSSIPDDGLISLAADGSLREPAVLRQQVERMLDDPKVSRFVENFCGQWLDLRRITITQPDEELYPEFDQLLLTSMEAETQAYFAEMVNSDLSVTHLVDSDFAMINGRLARHYEIPNVEGAEIRKVALPKESPRGGLLTQASLLKVTANGTTTSPVTRGAWVLDRIYGQPAQLPPPNVPAIEPDLRGTTTIREQLDKHRSIDACASCHREIDPPGFALENFDVIGGWRDRYRSLEMGAPAQKTFKDNRPVRYKLGLPVDASGQAPDGASFNDIHDFRRILLAQKEQLARNMVQRLLVYATGAEIQFADRPVVEKILDQCRQSDYGIRSLIHEVVRSEIFQRK